MVKGLSEQELEFAECLFNPICFIESTTPATDLSTWDDLENDTGIKVRNYQIPFVAFDIVVEDDDKLSEYDNFKRREKAGTVILISARKIGKTFIGLVRNALAKLVLYNGQEMTLSCYDLLHVKKMADELCDYFENHLFFRQFKKSINRSPIYDIRTNNGNILQSVNENITGRQVGKQWWSHHTHFNFQDEIQATTNEAFEKKIDARGEKGCIEVLAGIPLIAENTPLSKFLKSPKYKNVTVRLPQYVSPFWNEDVKKDRIEEYGGENSANYLINVAAQTVEGAFGAFDMKRIRKECYRDDKIVKEFEVTDTTFSSYKARLILDHAKNASKVYVAADIGFTAATEIIVINEYNNKTYNFAYNITAYRLDDKQLSELIDWIFKQVHGDYVCIDCTIMGAPIYRQLVEKNSKDNVIWCSFNENVTIGFEKNDDGSFKFDKNNDPVEAIEKTSVFSIQRLRDLFYEGNLKIPSNSHKFEDQFSSFLQLVKGNRVTFDSTSEDHLVQSIVKDEVICCKIKDDLVVDSVEAIYSKTNKVSVPTYDKGKVVWKQGKIEREWNKGNKIFDLKFKPSKSLQVTEGHSMLVWNKEKQALEEKLAKDLKLGDLCLAAQNLNVKEPKNYLKLGISYALGKGHSPIAKSLILDEKLAYLLGWCCAEGSNTGDGGYCLSLGIDDPIEKLKNLTKDLFLAEPRVYTYGNCVQLVFRGGKGIASFMAKHVGSRAKNKIVPVSILNSKKSVRDAFEKGLIEGDGTAEWRLTTISRKVANGIFTLHSLKGKHTSFNFFKNKCNNYEYYLAEGKREKYFSNIPYSALKIDYSKKTGKTISRDKLAKANYKFTLKSITNKEILDKVKDFEFVELVKINTYEYDDYIYDLSVEGTNNFLAGAGNIVVHNSFQCFAIAQWHVALASINPIKRIKKLSLGSFS